MEVQYDLFRPANREWRVTTERDVNDTNTVHIGLATTDEDFTRDAKHPIEYYSRHYTFNPHATRNGYIRQCQQFVTAVIDNDEMFQEPEHWKVRQTEPHERPIMKRFTGVPMPYFWKLWRRPLIAQNIHFQHSGDDAQIFFGYSEENDPLMTMAFEAYLDWSGLFDDLKYGKKAIPNWLHRHCKGRLFLFSDFDTIFEDPEDEVSYLADFELCK